MAQTTMQRWLWGVLIMVLVGLGVATWLRGQDQRLLSNRSPERPTPTLDAPADLGQVPDFALTAQNGIVVTADDLRGDIWVTDFVFTRCASTCPMLSAEMQHLVETLPASTGVRFVSLSVDPEYDTPERLAAYADRYAADAARWLFLTGDKQAVRKLVREGFRIGVKDATPDEVAAGSDLVVHSTRFVLVDGVRHIRGYYNALLQDDLERLRQDVTHLVAERSVSITRRE